MTQKLSLNAINYINIGLMILAAGIAYVIPFELLLFSYAVLGPLHYLTQISWLHDRKYFSTGRFDYVFLILASLPMTIDIIFRVDYSFDWKSLLMWTAFGGAFGMAFFKSTTSKLTLIVGAAIVGFLFSKYPAYVAFVSVLLPTFIHVFIFTGAFILYGALKSKSNSGYISFAVFLALAVILLLMPVFDPNYQASTYIMNSSKPFLGVNQKLREILGLEEVWTSVLSITALLAYAYTYHYLNWFSKTQVIRWHEISKSRMAAILAGWVIAVGVYYLDYRIGFVTLFFLSLVHVTLEFPLNHQSFVGIGRELRKVTNL